MISIIGKGLLYLALFFAMLQSIVPLYGYKYKHFYLQAFARPSAIGQCLCIVTAYLLLTAAFITNDFHIAYVAAHSHPDLPLFYRIAAVWGGHEGSILLWILMLNAWSIVFSLVSTRWFANQPQLFLTTTLTLAIFGLLNLCFLCFLLFTSNPFLSALQPFAARDLNPLLQDPGLVIHPPMLYAGYVGFSATFALTFAALLQNQLNKMWAQLTRVFALAAWCLLTFGILLGSWWAYRVLGWGGFWFWDPVENASLLPWLSGTALLHILILTEKRDLAIQFTAFLALITFALSLMGTFLVRSGILISAHTFATDPSRGLFLLMLLSLFLIATLTVYIIRLPTLSAKKPLFFHWLSRETALLLNGALFFIAMLTVLLGTLYPLLFDALHWGAISIGPPYFNQVMLPLALLALILMAIGPLCAWQKQSLFLLATTLFKKAIISLLLAILLLISLTQTLSFIPLLSLSLSLFVILNIMDFVRTSPGMVLAHGGFAILIIGILLSSTLHQEREVRIQPGKALTLGPYHFFFITTNSIQGPNYRAIQAVFDIFKNKKPVTRLYPEKRIYHVRDMVMTKVAIHPGIFRDLYIALGEPLNETEWSVRVYYKPFIRWIWLGGLFMMIGASISIITTRKKIKCLRE